MKPVSRRTLEGICGELAAHPWHEEEIGELVEPKLGIITGFQDLMDELEALRRVDLGDLAPAQAVRKGPSSR